MPRTVPEEKIEVVKKLIREGQLTVRDVAYYAGVGVGTVSRLRAEMGLQAEDGRGKRNPVRHTMPAVIVETEPAPRTAPSVAAQRLAQFDPIVARALRGDPPLRTRPIIPDETE